MFNRLWQSGMIALAHSARIKAFMQGSRATSFLADKYVAGKYSVVAVETARKLRDVHAIRGSFFYLGEYVDTLERVDENVKNILEVVSLLENESMDVHVSVDPTQIGFSIDDALGRKNAVIIAEKILQASDNGSSCNCLMIDMEDFSVADATIELYQTLRKLNLPAALTLQAYLKRTENDMVKLIKAGAIVRLVKGAFTAAADVSFTQQKEIKKNYYRLVELMFSAQARDGGFYPVIATHDNEVQKYAISLARKNGWAQGEYEFEMLLGVRTDIAQWLASEGEKIRLYLPFGEDWWPYAVRRIGENPRNGVLLARSLIN